MNATSVIGCRYVKRHSSAEGNTSSLPKQSRRPREQEEKEKQVGDNLSDSRGVEAAAPAAPPCSAEQPHGGAKQPTIEDARRSACGLEEFSTVHTPPPQPISFPSPQRTRAPLQQMPPQQQQQRAHGISEGSESHRHSQPCSESSDVSVGNASPRAGCSSVQRCVPAKTSSPERLIERQLGNAFSSPVPAARQANKLYFVPHPRSQAAAVAAPGDALRGALQQQQQQRSANVLQRQPSSALTQLLSPAQAEFAQSLGEPHTDLLSRERASSCREQQELTPQLAAGSLAAAAAPVLLAGKWLLVTGLRGNLYTAVDRRDGSPVEVEVIAIEEYASDLYPLCSELIAASNLEHAGLAEQEGYYFQRSTGQLWVVARRPAEATLADRCRDSDAPLGEERVSRIVHECLQTLRYLQQRGFTYNLLNAETVYVGKDGGVKLSRLGCCSLAWSAASARRGTIARALHYASAPEVIKRKPLSTKADTWSVGVLVCELLLGRRLHQDLDLAMTTSKTARSGLRKTAKAIVASPEAINFLDRCLRKNPLKRATADEIARHPFLRKSSNSWLNAVMDRAAPNA